MKLCDFRTAENKHEGTWKNEKGKWQLAADLSVWHSGTPTAFVLYWRLAYRELLNEKTAHFDR
jgi:hypothetical protein